MAAFFQRVDSNTAAIVLSGGQSSVVLFQLDTLLGAVGSPVLPSSWLAPLRLVARRLIEITKPSERLTLDFARLLISIVDADGGSDATLSATASGVVLTVTMSAPADSTTLVSLQRSGAPVKPSPVVTVSGSSVDLTGYAKKSDIPSLAGFALKTEIPDVSGFALKTDLPSLTPYALKTDVPSISGLLSQADASSTYATKTDLANASGFARTNLLCVAKNGNDTTGDGSEAKPFLTIGAALTAANAVSGGYVRINVGPGEYTENVTISRARTILAGSGVDPEDHTTSIIGSLTIDCPTATQRYNDVVAIGGIYVNNGAKVTGTGAFMAVFTDCYLTTGDAAMNAVLVDNTHADRTIVYLRNCAVTKQGSATTDVVKLSKGDVRMDTVRVYGAVTGTGNGILINNNATLSADRLQVDINMQGAAIRVDGAFAGVTLTLSNAGLKTNYKGTGAAPALYLSNTVGSAAFIWQVMLMAADTASGKYAIDGLYNGNALAPPLIYGHVTFGPGTCTALGTQVSAAKLKMTDLA